MFIQQSQVDDVTYILWLQISHLIEIERFGNPSYSFRTLGLVCAGISACRSRGLKLVPQIKSYGCCKAEGRSLEISGGGRCVEKQIQRVIWREVVAI